MIQHRRRKFSKSLRVTDFAGFEATEDLQELAAEKEEDEVEDFDAAPDSDDGGSILYEAFSNFFTSRII